MGLHLLTTLLFLCFRHFQATVGEAGILHARSGTNNSAEATICIAYNPLYHSLPTEAEFSKTHLLADFSDSYGCSNIYGKNSVENKIVAVLRGNCTFAEKAEYVQDGLGSGALFVGYENGTGFTVPGARTDDDYNKINITMAFIMWKDYQTVRKLGKSVYIAVYSPESPKLDPNMACIFLIAVLCVGVGAYWSGVVKHEGVKSKFGSDDEKDDDAVDLSPVTLLILVILLCGMLVSLYFFYDYLVYAMIGLFTLAGSVGLYFCAQPLWKKLISCDSKLPLHSLKCCCENPPEYRGVLLYILCLSVSIFWAVQRHASYAWILQNILGAAFSINMLKTIRLPSLKVCTVLLVLLFFYDVFFVFITPLFTKNGESVMVKVATGGNSDTGEQLPMVFIFPKILTSALSICQDRPYSLLGFGDVLVPGLLISYNHWFDLHVGSSRIYYIASLIAYSVGLAFTFLALAFMEKGQPALLYLVPCTLIVTFLIACKRKEFRHIWSGEKCPKKDDDVITRDCDPPVPEVSYQGSVNRAISTSTLSSDTGEERGLIRT
ncbi:signal peptide peptidase-like 2B isoform X1 [Patella vulgata]|uniref:signal peptide peptidase-like 2B isoform X1 n=1 Tax=Patella vulgata TaxID=6465 RepID=UPI0024A8FBBB|nr:signal peptide peptidase-like 2B isoform X1 [Patella vulgata]